MKSNLKSVILSGLSSSLFSGLTLVALALQAAGLPANAQEVATPDREAVHQAFEACAVENNLAKPESGQRPSAADRKLIESCMTAKGFSPPPHGRGHGPGNRGDRRGPPPEEGSQVSQ